MGLWWNKELRFKVVGPHDVSLQRKDLRVTAMWFSIQDCCKDESVDVVCIRNYRKEPKRKWDDDNSLLNGCKVARAVITLCKAQIRGNVRKNRCNRSTDQPESLTESCAHFQIRCHCGYYRVATRRESFQEILEWKTETETPLRLTLLLILRSV